MSENIKDSVKGVVSIILSTIIFIGVIWCIITLVGVDNIPPIESSINEQYI